MSNAPIFLTGFGAFEGVAENPSGALAKALGEEPGIVGIELPVTFEGSASSYDRALDQLQESSPAALVSLGVHPGSGFRLEARAGALLGSDRPDNAGEVGSTLAGRMGGGEGDLRSSLDLAQLAEELRALDSGEVSISEDAGGYVCERVYRHLLVRAQERGIPGLFFHVPPLEETSLEIQATVVRGLLQGIRRQL